MKGKLFIGIFYSEDFDLNKVLDVLKEFGDIEEAFIEYDFSSFTEYYENEMGENLKKRFISFKELIDENEIGKIKLRTIEIEEEFKVDSKRKVNLDPGVVTKEKVVLPSVKEKSYKEDLGNRLFGHAVLIYEDGWKEFFHTFPDYRTEKVKNFLLKLRSLL